MVTNLPVTVLRAYPKSNIFLILSTARFWRKIYTVLTASYKLYYLALDIVVCLSGVPEKKISRQHRYILLNYNVKYHDISCNCYKRSSLDFFRRSIRQADSIYLLFKLFSLIKAILYENDEVCTFTGC